VPIGDGLPIVDCRSAWRRAGQDRTRIPSSARRAACAERGRPKSGDVMTPLKPDLLTVFRTFVARM
jgi:hypothetical protein